MLTAWNSTTDKLRGFELGAVDYLTKPFEAAELRARLCAALRTKHLQDELTQTNRELVRRPRRRRNRRPRQGRIPGQHEP